MRFPAFYFFVKNFTTHGFRFLSFSTSSCSAVDCVAPSCVCCLCKTVRTSGSSGLGCAFVVLWSLIHLLFLWQNQSGAATEIREVFCNVGLINTSSSRTELRSSLLKKNLCFSSLQISYTLWGILTFLLKLYMFSNIHILIMNIAQNN